MTIENIQKFTWLSLPQGKLFCDTRKDIEEREREQNKHCKDKNNGGKMEESLKMFLIRWRSSAFLGKENLVLREHYQKKKTK